MDKIFFKGKGHSGAFDLNLLYNESKIYIMDNHLAASWCWLQKLDINSQYKLFHIDRHYDLLDSDLDNWIQSLENIDITRLEITDLINLKSSNSFPISNPLFRWDNYIPILNKLYPNLIISSFFATQKYGDPVPVNRENKFKSLNNFIEVDAWNLESNIEGQINSDDKKWIINLDIDYFFIDYEDIYFQMYTDEFIIRIAQRLKAALDRIEVFTIALSPEMCGGWEKSERVANLILKEFDIDWNI